MPELPVIRALAERIETQFSGQEVAGVVLLQFSCLKTVEPPIDALAGGTLAGVASYGKYLVLPVGDLRVVLHLSQAGRVTFEEPAKTSRGRGGVLRLNFARDPEGTAALFVHEFGRERRVGIWVLAGDDPGPLAKLGPEALDPVVRELLMTSGDKRRLHTVLRDQRFVAGIGRGHADDILHRARLAPMRSLASLDEAERHRLHESLVEDLTLRLDVERGREGGLPAKLSEDWRVHGHWGEPCPHCATELARVSYEEYEMTYCPRCQTEGKILADRRRSRFLK